MTVHFLLAILLSAPLTLLAQNGNAPAETVRAFYSEYQKLHISGLPDSAALEKLTSYLSPQLVAALTRAQQRQSNCIAAHPGDKGPWVEGDMFSSNFEGFTNLRVDDPKPGKGLRQLLQLNFEYIESGKSIPWVDQVMTIKKGNRWLIDNVIYGRKPGFGNG